MIPEDNIQSIFLEEVKKQIPPNISFADDLSEILSISRDSAYRRIRGETILSLDEVSVICGHYGVSLDSLFAPTSNTVTFHHRMIGYDNFGFDKWLNSILANLETIQTFPEKELIYTAKDVPLFHHFEFPELTAFKIYFWNKTVLGLDFQDEKFRLELIPNELMAITRRILAKYVLTPSTELWSEETINVTLRQIEFHCDCGFFQRPGDIGIILDQFVKMLNTIRSWAASGVKGPSGGKYSLYKNDILIPETTVFFKMGDKRICYLTHNTMDLLTTSNEGFCKQTEKYLNNLLNKAIQISTTGEKERNRFFNMMEEKVEVLRRRVS
jgi:hypothetical protein